MFGTLGFSGIVPGSSGGSGGNPPSGSGYYQTLNVVSGSGAQNPVNGSFTFAPTVLASALNVSFIIVNNFVEVIGTNFTFVAGTITRNSAWQNGDVAIIPYSRIS